MNATAETVVNRARVAFPEMRPGIGLDLVNDAHKEFSEKYANHVPPAIFALEDVLPESLISIEPYVYSVCRRWAEMTLDPMEWQKWQRLEHDAVHKMELHFAQSAPVADAPGMVAEERKADSQELPDRDKAFEQWHLNEADLDNADLAYREAWNACWSHVQERLREETEKQGQVVGGFWSENVYTALKPGKGLRLCFPVDNGTASLIADNLSGKGPFEIQIRKPGGGQ